MNHQDGMTYTLIAVVFLLVGLISGMLIVGAIGKENKEFWCSKNYELYSEVQACIRKGPHKIPEINIDK